MSLDGIARFALSRSGRAYAASCQRFGVDPAADLGVDDDVIAVNLRQALHYSLNLSRLEPEAEADGGMSDEDFLRSIAKVEAAAR